MERAMGIEPTSEVLERRSLVRPRPGIGSGWALSDLIWEKGNAAGREQGLNTDVFLDEARFAFCLVMLDWVCLTHNQPTIRRCIRRRYCRERGGGSRLQRLLDRKFALA